MGTCVRHGQEARHSVLVDKVLVFELLSIDALAASAIAIREVSSLAHE